MAPGFRPFRIALALLTAAAAPAAVAHGQISVKVGADFAFASAYLDRGVIRTNQPVLQPGLTIGLPGGAGGGAIALGIWATVEPATYTGSEYFSMAPGGKSPDVTEVRPSLALSQPVGPASFVFKATMQLFPNPVGITKDGNTLDLASTVALPRSAFSPALTLAYDIGAINGAYLEARARQAVGFAKGAELGVGGRAGWSIRQQVDSAPAAFAPYERSGFTHLDLTVDASLSIAGATVKPYLTYIYVPNPAGDSLAPGRQRRDMVVFGTSVSVSGVFPKAKK